MIKRKRWNKNVKKNIHKIYDDKEIVCDLTDKTPQCKRTAYKNHKYKRRLKGVDKFLIHIFYFFWDMIIKNNCLEKKEK